MTETQTTICNKALNLIGEEGINSINDNSLQANACKNYYDLALNLLLEDGAWSHTVVEQPLVKVDTDEYAEEHKYIYVIPSNCVLIKDIYQKHERKQGYKSTDWDIRYFPAENKNYIICDCDEDMYIKYVYNNSNTNTYSAKFIQALVSGLAFQICMYITKDSEKTNAMLALYNATKADALRTNYNEVGEEKLDWVSPITASRG